MTYQNDLDDRRSGPPRVQLLGGFSVTQNQQIFSFPADAQRLVAFLALRKQRLSRSSVAGNLWLDSTQGQAFASLRSALWRVRQARIRLVDADSRTLALADDVCVDIDKLDDASVNMRLHRDIEVDDHSPFTHELLVGWHDEWAVVERERLRQISLHFLEAMTDQLRRRGDHAGAIDAALAAIRLDPLRESAHRCLIRVHLAEGNRSEAIRASDQYATRLRDELDINPSPLMSELMRQQPV